MLLIAHRGASGYRPEHTIAAYQLAIEQGADVIEPDLVSSKDSHLIVRHENDISGTTNVKDISIFASRKCTKVIDGKEVEGFFTEDFTLEELKTLRCRERIPDIRKDNVKWKEEQIVTFQEVVDLIRSTTGRVVGIYPETKHPSYFLKLGFDLNRMLIDCLEKNGLNSVTDSKYPVFIQSFEVNNLKEIRKLTPLPLVQLIEKDGAPYDYVLAGDKRTYKDLITPKGLAEIASYSQFVGVQKDLVIARDKDGNLLETATSLVQDCKKVKLGVHIWTLRSENFFLPTNLKVAPKESNSTIGDVSTEIKEYLKAGIDGFFCDSPDIGRKAIDSFKST